MQSYEEFYKTLSDEVKQRAKKLLDEICPWLNDSPPIYVGPEGRAMAEGPEALKKYYKEGEKYQREVDLDELEDWA